jgi:hypothetical protein
MMGQKASEPTLHCPHQDVNKTALNEDTFGGVKMSLGLTN